MADRNPPDSGPLLLFALGFVLVFVGGCLLLGGFSAGRRWKSTTGTVAESEIVKHEFHSVGRRGYGETHTDTAAKFSYDYRVGGKAYSASKVDHGLLVSWLSGLGGRVAVFRYTPGTRVTVYYDPSRPGRAVLSNGIPWEAPIEIVFGGLLMVAAWHWNEHQRRSADSGSKNVGGEPEESPSETPSRSDAVADWLANHDLSPAGWTDRN